VRRRYLCGYGGRGEFSREKMRFVFWGGRSEIRGEILRKWRSPGWRPKRAPLHGLGWKLRLGREILDKVKKRLKTPFGRMAFPGRELLTG